MNTIQRSYPNFFKEFDHEAFEVQAKLWYRSLADYNYRDIVTAFEFWINTEKYPPSLAEFKEIVVKIKNPQSNISGERAWEQVNNAVRRFGSYNQDKAFATFSEPIKRAVRNVGGWQKICQTELGREWDFLRKNFIDVYNDFNAENRENELLPTPVLHRLQELMRQNQLEKPKNERIER